LLSSEAPSYHASKAGSSNYLGGLASALKTKGVHVTNVRFGFVDTKMAKGDVWLQNTGGTLDPPVTYSVTHGGYDELDAGDVNNDGLTDLVVMSGQGLYPNLGVPLQNASGGFSAAVYYDLSSSALPHGVAVGDVTGDNLDDITVSYGGNSPSSKIGVFAQDSYGTMDPAVVYSAYDIPEPVILGDADSDSLKDVIVAHGGWRSISIFAQAPDGSLLPYQRYTVPYASHYKPQGLDAGDINNDGELDIILADYNNGLVVLYHKSVPFVGVDVLPGSVPENGSGIFVFQRSTVNLAQSLVVFYTVEGSAEADSDYPALSGYVGFPAGVDSVQVPVALIDDPDPECDETIVLTLSDRPEYNLMPQSSAVLTILENDQTVISISAPDDQARERGFKTGKFTVSRTGNTGVPLIVPLNIGGTAVNGVDYQVVPGAVTFAAGAVSVDIYIQPLNDKLPEGQESVEFEITDASCLYTVNPQSFKSTVWIYD
jgi:hypothetical protein